MFMVLPWAPRKEALRLSLHLSLIGEEVGPLKLYISFQFLKCPDFVIASFLSPVEGIMNMGVGFRHQLLYLIAV